jgi:carotenoid 1,2-hydratase
VAPNGYAWWYVDAFSADHRYGMTIIAFIGSVFSPYYASRRRARGVADPAQHCSLNVAVYGPGVGRWAMTERCAKALKPAEDALAIGPSSVHWDGERLRIEICEKAPLTLKPLRGTVTLTPEILPDFTTDFGTDGRHRWSPIAPRAHVEVRLSNPSLSWDGTGYFDMNRGDEPIEEGFSYWNWSRACLPRKAAILYDVTRHGAGSSSMGIEIAADGAVTPVDLPERLTLPATPVWKMPREMRCDRGQSATVAETFEDTPFYSRSMLATRLLGEPVNVMHESISLDRFRKLWVQTLLRFRMPRVTL